MDGKLHRFGSAIAQRTYDMTYWQHLSQGHAHASRQALIAALRARDRLERGTQANA